MKWNTDYIVKIEESKKNHFLWKQKQQLIHEKELAIKEKRITPCSSPISEDLQIQTTISKIV